MEREDLFSHLKFNTQVLTTKELEVAFRAVDRARFLEEQYLPEAYEDYAVPIGFGKMLAKPTILAFMLELLAPAAGHRVMEIPSGSGYGLALLSHIVGEKGRVYGIEKEAELRESSKMALEEYGFSNFEIISPSPKIGLPDEAQFDRILIMASLPEVHEDLVSQLRDGGIMVLAFEDSIVQVKKIRKNKTEERFFQGFYLDSM